MVKKKLSLIAKCVCIFSSTLIFFSNSMAEENKTPIEHEAGVYYTVKKGDTLWDLSKRFSDSPWLWPDLWKENPQIPNPHFIYPGERIRLFHDQGVEAESTQSSSAAVESANLVQPAEPEREAPYFYCSSINNVGFIKTTPVAPYGVIFKVKGGHTKISQDDVVYIRPSGDKTLAPGSRHTVCRTFDAVIDNATKNNIGTRYYLTGLVEIMELDPQFAIAKVIRSYRTIEINDMIIPYQKRSSKITMTDSVEGLEGTILLGEEQQTIIGDNTVVFIDKGDKDGVKPGQKYNIYYQEAQPVDAASKENVLLKPMVFGNLIVLLTEETTAAALVVRSQKIIEPGDKFTSPTP